MMSLGCKVIEGLGRRTLSTAESLTGGGIGACLTAVPGSSLVYKGGIISYTDEIKNSLLGVAENLLKDVGAVSAPVAEAMASGARSVLHTDFAVSVTGLAGPGGDTFGNPVGTVFIGFSSAGETFSRKFFFAGDREKVREQTLLQALQIILENI